MHQTVYGTKFLLEPNKITIVPNHACNKDYDWTDALREVHDALDSDNKAYRTVFNMERSTDFTVLSDCTVGQFVEVLSHSSVHVTRRSALELLEGHLDRNDLIKAAERLHGRGGELKSMEWLFRALHDPHADIRNLLDTKWRNCHEQKELQPAQ